MFKFNKVRRLRRRERVWQILKEKNPGLTKERFDTEYDTIVNLMSIQTQIGMVIDAKVR
jgi:hypothetical protein